MTFDIDNARSYASRDNLEAGLERFGFADDRHIVVKNTANRWTAIFPASNIQGGYIGRYAAQGFLTLG